MRISITDGGIDFAPATVVEEVLQNVRMIIATRAGTVPLDRDFGLSWAAVDAPISVARARVRHDVVEKIRRYEPRATVKGVQYDGRNAETGELLLSVDIEVAQ